VEIQVYGVRRRERAAVRARVRTGSHVPHPAIVPATGRRVEIAVRPDRPWPLETDRQRRGQAVRIAVDVVPQAFVLVV
jgi:hypothetical protein